MVPEVMPPGRTPMWANAWLAVVSTAAGALGAGLAAGLNHLFSTDVTLTVAAWCCGTGAPGVRCSVAEIERARRPTNGAIGRRCSRRGWSQAAGHGEQPRRGWLPHVPVGVPARDEGEAGRSFAVAAVCAGVGAFAGAGLAPVLRRRQGAVAARSCRWRDDGRGAVGVGSVQPCHARRPGGHRGPSAPPAGGWRSTRCCSRTPSGTFRGRTFARYETIFQLCWVAGAGLATAVPFRAVAGMRSLRHSSRGWSGVLHSGLIRRRPTGRRTTSAPGRAG